jgi:hypothetical protein
MIGMRTRRIDHDFIIHLQIADALFQHSLSSRGAADISGANE